MSTDNTRRKIKRICQKAFAEKKDDLQALQEIYALANDDEKWDEEYEEDDEDDEDEEEDENEQSLLDDVLDLIPDDD